VQDSSLVEKLDFLEYLKSLGMEAQYSIDEWKMFSQYLQKMTPSIYQTTFEGLSHHPAKQLGAASSYQHRF
jgi:hypothetical protein